jgi:RNA-binding protein YhbY
MAESMSLAEAKRKLSRRLLDEAGVSGVGIRGSRLVVYLEADDPSIRRKARELARQIDTTAPLVFEVTGRFRKQ